jgi:hypothetical protein
MTEMNEAYLEILRMIENGTISAEEGAMLLDALNSGSRPEVQPAHESLEGRGTTVDEKEHRPSGPPAWAQQLWMYPLAGGAVLAGLAGMATALLVQGGSRLGWLVCTLPLMLSGALVMALAWWSRTSRWLHVRVRDKETRFRFSLPLPLRPAAWLARLARPWVPQMRDVPLDELILTLADMEEKDILAVEVNDEGEGVQVYLG